MLTDAILITFSRLLFHVMLALPHYLWLCVQSPTGVQSTMPAAAPQAAFSTAAQSSGPTSASVQTQQRTLYQQVSFHVDA